MKFSTSLQIRQYKDLGNLIFQKKKFACAWCIFLYKFAYLSFILLNLKVLRGESFSKILHLVSNEKSLAFIFFNFVKLLGGAIFLFSYQTSVKAKMEKIFYIFGISDDFHTTKPSQCGSNSWNSAHRSPPLNLLLPDYCAEDSYASFWLIWN